MKITTNLEIIIPSLWLESYIFWPAFSESFSYARDFDCGWTSAGLSALFCNSRNLEGAFTFDDLDCIKSHKSFWIILTCNLFPNLFEIRMFARQFKTYLDPFGTTLLSVTRSQNATLRLSVSVDILSVSLLSVCKKAIPEFNRTKKS